MKGGVLVFLFAALLQGEPEGSAKMDAQAEPTAAPRAPIDKLPGLRITSEIAPPETESAPLQLEAYYVFPQRVRWTFTAKEEERTARWGAFRFGQSAWWTSDFVHSVTLDSPGAQGGLRRVDLQLELRRALFLWPAGFDWRPNPEGLLQAALTELPSRGDGERAVIVSDARTGERPSRLVVEILEATGASHRGPMYVDIAWNLSADRPRPRSFLWVGCGPEGWRETVLDVTGKVNLLDHFFLPPDRKPALPGGLREGPVAARLSACVESRAELATGADLASARLRALQAWDSFEADCTRRGWTPETWITVEVDDSGNPRALLLRAIAPAGELAAGWSKSAACEAVSLPLRGDRVTAAHHRWLLEALPPGAQPVRLLVQMARSAEGAPRSRVCMTYRRR